MHPPITRGPAATFALLLLGLLTASTRVQAQNSPGPAPGSEQADSSYFRATHFAPRDTLSPTVYQGWKQFELNCARCHGDFGVGTSFAPALVESVKPTGTIPTPELFIQTVCAGRVDKGMPAWCALGLEIGTIQEIYSYLKDRSAGRIGEGRPALRAE